jgi:nucleoside-diphosphate-sugar epimerase
MAQRFENTENIMKNTVLILGARGRLGGALAQAFAAAGWRVLAQRRTGGKDPSPAEGIQWVQAEAGDTAALVRAATGARVVVHAMNPAYTAAAWRAQAPGLLQAAIDAAAALGAMLLFPGNVYNFGADMPALLAPDTPQRPGTEKGRIRVDLEQQLAQATNTRGLQAVVIRAGDFFGAGSGSWLDQVIVKKLPQGRVTWPGALDLPHAWAYLPDLARAFVHVAETTCRPRPWPPGRARAANPTCADGCWAMPSWHRIRTTCSRGWWTCARRARSCCAATARGCCPKPTRSAARS